MRRVRREPAVTHKSKSNENKTRKNKLSTNYTVCCWMLGKLRSGKTHLLVVARCSPPPDVTCTVCSEQRGLENSARGQSWEGGAVIPQSMHNPDTVFWDTPGIMCLWVPQLLNATLSSFLLKFQSSENFSQPYFPSLEYFFAALFQIRIF